MPSPHPSTPNLLRRLMPGAAALLAYRRADLAADVRAGSAVAAVAIPVGVAYAQLAGFSPALGLYASLLPLIAYALFGTSRQLVVGPDAATCAMVAGTLATLGAVDADTRLALSALLSLFAGLLLIGASRLHLGALADFLSRPILLGFLNGVALNILLGQSGSLIGIGFTAHDALHRVSELAGGLGHANLPTLLLALATFALLRLGARHAPSLPAALLALIGAALATRFAGLEALGVKTLGEVAAGLPALRLELSAVPGLELGKLLLAAGGVALISFCNAIVVSRSFAARGGYEVDADLELRALGAANIASALSGSFAVSAADSRTAVAEHAGARTQMTSIVAALWVALCLISLTPLLALVPTVALAVILVDAALSLLDTRGVRELGRLSRHEMWLSLATTAGVLGTGVLEGIAVALALSLLRFIHAMARPEDEVLGQIDGVPGFHDTGRHPDARQTPGVLIYRFNAPLVFFNAPTFSHRLLAACQSRPGLSTVILDMMPVSRLDATGRYTLDEVAQRLDAQGIRLVIAGRRTELLQWQAAHLSQFWAQEDRLFPTVKQALKACTGQDKTAMTLSDS